MGPLPHCRNVVRAQGARGQKKKRANRATRLFKCFKCSSVQVSIIRLQTHNRHADKVRFCGQLASTASFPTPPCLCIQNVPTKAHTMLMVTIRGTKSFAWHTLNFIFANLLRKRPEMEKLFLPVSATLPNRKAGLHRTSMNIHRALSVSERRVVSARSGKDAKKSSKKATAAACPLQK